MWWERDFSLSVKTENSSCKYYSIITQDKGSGSAVSTFVDVNTPEEEETCHVYHFFMLIQIFSIYLLAFLLFLVEF